MDHLIYFGHGVLHSLSGAVKFWSLEPVSKVALNAAAQGQQLTVLQRRRLERQKILEAAAASGNDANGAKQPASFTRSPRRLLMQCLLWNGIIFLVSIGVFQFLLLPAVGWIVTKLLVASSTSTSDSGSSSQQFLSLIFATLELAFDCLWLLPLFLIGKVVNAIWFQDLADVVYYQRRDTRVVNMGMGQSAASLIFSLIVQTVVLVQAELFTMVPAIGWLIGLLHHSLLCSFYCFDYRWTSEGRRVADRIHMLERYWPYYCGFGLILACVCVGFQSIFVRGCVFSLIFPIFIVSAMESQLPTAVHNNSKLSNNSFNDSASVLAANLTSGTSNQQNGVVVAFSPLPILTPAVKITDVAFRKFISKAKTAVQTKQSNKAQSTVS